MLSVKNDSRQAHQYGVLTFGLGSGSLYTIYRKPLALARNPIGSLSEVLFTNKNGDFDEVSGTKRDCSATILRVDRKDRMNVELHLINHFTLTPASFVRE